MPVSPGQMIRETRRRYGLSQAQLARRTGTGQSAISRLEKDEISPTAATLRLLMRAMGEELDLTSARPDSGQDSLHRKDWRSRSPAERLRLASSWNRFAGRLEHAGKAARGAR